MAKLIASRTAQYPLVAEFTFDFDDTMTAVNGATVDFGRTNTASTVVEAIPLPPGAVVIGGAVDTHVAFDAATFNVTIGDSGSANRYLATTDRKAVGTSPLVPTGYRGTGENLRITFQAADVCTAGRMTVRVMYIVANRAQEVQIA